jgi:hypothetical protein
MGQGKERGMSGAHKFARAYIFLRARIFMRIKDCSEKKLKVAFKGQMKAGYKMLS